MKKLLIMFLLFALVSNMFLLICTANDRVEISDENVNEIQVFRHGMGQPYIKYTITDKDAISYVIWLFNNVELYDDSEGFTSDIGSVMYYFKNSEGEVLQKIEIDILGSVWYWGTTDRYDVFVCNLDYKEMLYMQKRILSICNGETVIESGMMSEPSQWSKDLVESAVDKNLIPKLNQIGYTTAISRLDVCEIVEGFLFNYMNNDSVISYFKDFYYNLEVMNTDDDKIQEKMTDAQWQQYTEMRSLEKENLFDDFSGGSGVLLRALGIIDGKENNNFCPNDLITREEMAKILSNLWHYINLDLVIEAEESNYNDYDEISDWAKVYVDEMSTIGILKGDDNGNFDPGRHMTKEEVIVSLMRLFGLV